LLESPKHFLSGLPLLESPKHFSSGLPLLESPNHFLSGLSLLETPKHFFIRSALAGEPQTFFLPEPEPTLGGPGHYLNIFRNLNQLKLSPLDHLEHEIFQNKYLIFLYYPRRMKLNNVQEESNNLHFCVCWQPIYEKLLFKTELHDPIKGIDYMNGCQCLMKE